VPEISGPTASRCTTGIVVLFPHLLKESKNIPCEIKGRLLPPAVGIAKACWAWSIMPVSFKDIVDGFLSVSASGTGEHRAFLCRHSDRIYSHSDDCDDLKEIHITSMTVRNISIYPARGNSI